MKDFIAYCGLDCEKCQARIATINNDDELREKVAKEWTELNKVTITKSMINCTGCKIEGVKTPFCDKLCEIKKCASLNNYSTCGDCAKYKTCDTLSMITNHNDYALKNLEN